MSVTVDPPKGQRYKPGESPPPRGQRAPASQVARDSRTRQEMAEGGPGGVGYSHAFRHGCGLYMMQSSVMSSTYLRMYIYPFPIHWLSWNNFGDRQRVVQAT
jgi:hypothetical protein